MHEQFRPFYHVLQFQKCDHPDDSSQYSDYMLRSFGALLKLSHSLSICVI